MMIALQLRSWHDKLVGLLHQHEDLLDDQGLCLKRLLELLEIHQQNLRQEYLLFLGRLKFFPFQEYVPPQLNAARI